MNEVERDIDANLTQDKEAFRCECDAIRSVALALKDESEPALQPLHKTASADQPIHGPQMLRQNVVRFGHLKRGDLMKSSTPRPGSRLLTR